MVQVVTEGQQYPSTQMAMGNPARVMANIMRRTAELEAGKYAQGGPMEVGGGRYRVDAMRPGTMVFGTAPDQGSQPGEFMAGAAQGQDTYAWRGLAPQQPSPVGGDKYRAAGYQPANTQVSGQIESPPATHRQGVLAPATLGAGRQLGEPRAAEFADSYGRAKAR